MFLDISDAYNIQLRYASKVQILGWKLGGSNTLTRDIFDVDVPYFGFLQPDQIAFTDREKIVHKHNKFELEYCVWLPENFDSAYDYKCDEIRNWHVTFGLEFPHTRIENIPEKGVSHLVADNCASGYLVTTDHKIDYQPLDDFLLLVNDKYHESRIDLTDDVSILVKKFLDEARLRHAPVEGGQVIATGGLTPLIHLNNGDQVKVIYNNITALTYEYHNDF